MDTQHQQHRRRSRTLINKFVANPELHAHFSAVTALSWANVSSQKTIPGFPAGCAGPGRFAVQPGEYALKTAPVIDSCRWRTLSSFAYIRWHVPLPQRTFS